MRWPTLAKRKQVLLPTPFGWLALAALAGGIVMWAWPRTFRFLAPQQPAHARILVVEGWLEPEALDQVLAAVHNGGYERVLTAGGPITSWADRIGFTNYADLAADYLVKSGLDAGSVTAVPAPASAQERTFLSAVEVRDRLRSEGAHVDAIDVYSWGCHARRTWLMYRMAFGPEVKVGILAATPTQYGADDWWRSSIGAKTVLQEYVALVWNELFFWPGEPGSADERWAVGPSTR